ncbi:hypothetical protein Scep_026709 [Stephania cephalantha]|uniref:Apyrase 7 n=1 Tax=Stephania cephalantha TaxID=152367 RepID=A0AAP0ENA1_9MAGN
MAGSHSSTGPSASSGLLLSGLDHVLGLSKTGQNHLRFSSSLQDFSTYRGLDPEVGELDTRSDQSTAHLIKPRPLDRENGGSSFSKEKTLAGLPFLRRKWVRATILIICLFLFFYLVFICAKYLDTYWSQETNFYVVLDCGSTGTRVYVYQSSIRYKEDGNLPITLESLPKELHRRSSRSGRAYQRMETEPGFDKLVHNKSGLKAAIKPLLHWAAEQIPKQAHKRTSLFLYATAGVRRLQRPDSKWLLDNAWSILRKSPFLCRREWVKIISGMEEAYYGWVALNYQTGKLGSIPGKATFGALDLGGSSLQVTFETQEPVQGETSLNLSIGATTHHLSAYSLSGYGLNDAFDKSVSGYQEQYMCSHCALLSQDGGSPLTGERSMGKGGKPGVPIKLLGAPQWEECSELAKVAVNLSEWSDSNPGIDCELQPCALRDGLPRPRGQFHAMSGFFVVFKFFNLTKEATLDDVLQKGQEFCEKTWEVAKNSVAPQPFIEQYCFRAPYVASLLREGLHIADSQVVIGSGSITWTLGVALLEAGKALSAGMDFHRNEIFQMTMSPAILFFLLITSLMLLICTLSWVGNCIPRFFRRAYLPLLGTTVPMLLLFLTCNLLSSSSVGVLSAQFYSKSIAICLLNEEACFLIELLNFHVLGDGRIKMPLSPTVAGSQQRPFGMGHGLGGSSIQLMESSLHQSTGSVSHSYSSGSLGQMQFENNGIGSFWNPGRGQMRLQSRRSQSREDLNSSIAEGHIAKV